MYVCGVVQVNDDTQIVTPNWAPAFIKALEENPLAPNVGVTGPSDTHNRQIFTHSFVHRTHFEVCEVCCWAFLRDEVWDFLACCVDIWLFVSSHLQELVVG